MAFHACSATECGSPSNHYTYLAESSDLTHWSIVSGWTAYQGSVPDVIQKGTNLYIFNPGTVRKLDLVAGTLGPSRPVAIRTVEGNQVRFVDPSPILDGSGRVALFYLDSTSVPLGADPAGCVSYPCDKNFGSAVEVDGSDMTQFVADPGFRATVGIASGSASDPDIFAGAPADGYVMYVSMGNGIEVWTSATLAGSYTRQSSVPNKGGVPAGYHDGSQYWFFGALDQGSGKNIVAYNAATISGLPSAPASYTLTPGSFPGLGGTTRLVDSPGILRITR
jgi:hypothetical protein